MKSMFRHSAVRFIAFAAMLLAAFSFATAASAAMTQGKEYRFIPPKSTPAPSGKIAVMEFFSYFCPHCRALNPYLDKWAKTLPSDVVLIRVPVIWGKAPLKALARAYYTLDALGADAVADEIFDAYQTQRINVADENTFFDWAAKHKLDRAKVESMYHSFAVDTKVAQSADLEKDYQVNDIPHIFINGNIEMNLEAFKDFPAFLNGINEAIQIARKQNQSKK
jgi:thiol:disulfide interchange protein DsbA